MRFGVHISISGKLKDVITRAKERGCETIQIFTRNPRSWSLPKNYPQGEINEFKNGLFENNIQPLIVHLPYLPNIASSDKELYHKSLEILVSDIEIASILGASCVVVHAGSCKDGIERGIELASGAINYALGKTEDKKEVMVLIENQAGGGSEIGYDLYQIKNIIERIEDVDRVGVCLDICHIYVAGYDISTKEGLDETLELFSKLIGLEKLKLLHVNDTDSALGSKIDKHQDIGKGRIKKEGFTNVVNHKALSHLPVILETPIISKEDDIRNLQTIRSLLKFNLNSRG